MTAIGVVRSPFKEKFGIPRQPDLCSVKSTLILNAPGMTMDCLAGLTLHSHIWVLFQFHQNLDKGWKAKVRPPRLGGNDKLGVFATRSSFRPNGIGMSAVKLLAVDSQHGQPCILVEGLDLVDGTPILDIKPYVPYSDSIQSANSEMAPAPPASLLQVTLSAQAEDCLTKYSQRHPDLPELIKQVLAQDPRPSYKKNKIDEKTYGIRLYNFNIRWQITDDLCHVLSIEEEGK